MRWISVGPIFASRDSVCTRSSSSGLNCGLPLVPGGRPMASAWSAVLRIEEAEGAWTRGRGREGWKSCEKQRRRAWTAESGGRRAAVVVVVLVLVFGCWVEQGRTDWNGTGNGTRARGSTRLSMSRRASERASAQSPPDWNWIGSIWTLAVSSGSWLVGCPPEGGNGGARQAAQSPDQGVNFFLWLRCVSPLSCPLSHSPAPCSRRRRRRRGN